MFKEHAGIMTTSTVRNPQPNYIATEKRIQLLSVSQDKTLIYRKMKI
ncbi:hypothetical protein [Clostridium saccharobutylicum]|nr:hypothetical protein [Clostridium saccharobutylicum]